MKLGEIFSPVENDDIDIAFIAVPGLLSTTGLIIEWVTWLTLGKISYPLVLSNLALKLSSMQQLLFSKACFLVPVRGQSNLY